MELALNAVMDLTLQIKHQEHYDVNEKLEA